MISIRDYLKSSRLEWKNVKISNVKHAYFYVLCKNKQKNDDFNACFYINLNVYFTIKLRLTHFRQQNK